MRAFNSNGSSNNGSHNSTSSGGSNISPPVNHHVFTSVLAHSSGSGGGAGGRGPRHFDVLARRNAAGQQQQNGVTKDQACADHQLQAIVRLKGANILRQRLLVLLRQKFSKEFSQVAALQQLQVLQQSTAPPAPAPPPVVNNTAVPSTAGGPAVAQAAAVEEPPAASSTPPSVVVAAVDVPTTPAVPSAPSTPPVAPSPAPPVPPTTAVATTTKAAELTPLHLALLAIEEMIISVDNSDVVNAGYLRDFAKTQHHHQSSAHQAQHRNSAGNGGRQQSNNSSNQDPRLTSPVHGNTSNIGRQNGPLTSTSTNCQCVCATCGVKKTQRSGSLGAAPTGSMQALSNERMLSLGTPSFILQSSSHAFGGIALATESRFGIAGPSAVSQTPSEVSSSAVEDSDEDDNDFDDEDAGDDRAAAALIPDAVDHAERLAEMRKREEAEAAEVAAAGMSGLRSGAFYEMRVKRVVGSGTVVCPKCLCNLAEVPAAPVVVCADASTNTAERSESEKDFMLTSLTKAKVDTEKKLEDMKKELQAFKKAKYASQNLATPQQQGQATTTAATANNNNSNGSTAGGQHSSPQVRASTHQRDDPGPLPLHDNVAMGTMSPTRASTPGVGSYNDNEGVVSNNSFPTASAAGPTTRASTSTQLRGSPSGRHGSSSVGASPASRAGGSRGVPSRRPQAAVDMTNDSLFGSPATASAASATTFEGSSPSATQQQHRINLALRLNSSIRDMRAKLNALRSGIRSFQFKEVIGQFSQHVIPQLQQVQATNKRLLDRDYILEKLLLDALCKVGTMPDSGSPEGYLPEGGPLHVGTYSLLDDRRFLEWTRRISETLSGKVTAVQSYIQALSNELKFQQPSGGAGKKGADSGTILEERIVALEGSLVENECFNVSNILDHTFDSSTAVQGTRRTELVTLLKHAAETNEEIRLIYVVPSWATKPQLRVKMNMWRQRRLEALQKVEQLLHQELQHFVSSGAQKIMLKGKLMTIRELIQLASRLHLMPNTSGGAATGGGGGGKNAVAAAAALSAASAAVSARATSPPAPVGRGGGSRSSVVASSMSTAPPAVVTSPTSAHSLLDVPTAIAPSSLNTSAASAPLLPPSLTNVGMQQPANTSAFGMSDEFSTSSPLSASPSGSGSTMYLVSASNRRLEALPASTGAALLASAVVTTSPPSSAEGGAGGRGSTPSASLSVGSPISRRAVSGGASKLPPVK